MNDPDPAPTPAPTEAPARLESQPQPRQASPRSVAPDSSTAAATSWYLALNLAERRPLVGSAENPAAEPEHQADPALTARRLEQWRRQAPFEDETWWRRRLAADNLAADGLQDSEDEAALRLLVGLTSSGIEDRLDAPPPWLAKLLKAYDPESECEPFPWPPSEHRDRCAFLPLVDPLMTAAFAELLTAAREIAEGLPEPTQAPFDPDTAAKALAADLPARLAPMLTRPLLVELHAAKLEERLTGDTPEARFEEFVDELRQPHRALEILGRYPVLARALVERIDQWRRGSVRFLQDLAADAEVLGAKFGSLLGPERWLGQLSEVRGAVGDPHRDGREVLLLRFDSGFRLVYKPKSLALEATFQELLGWFNQRGFEPAFRRIQVVDRTDRGWIEFVESQACESIDELRRFYQRQGGFLGIFYALNGTDFHHENLIAAGEHPVPVDLETLFQPWLGTQTLRDIEQQPGASLRNSVLNTHLLPNQLWGKSDAAGVDLSGLAARAGQLTPTPVLSTVDRRTDKMRVERRRIEIPISDHLPRLEGEETSVLPYAADFEQGFRRLYRILREEAPALTANDGPLAAFATAETRVLIRPTATYGLLYLESFHPHLLGNAVLRERFLDHLWAEAPHRPYLSDLVPTERRQLQRGDIPAFFTYPGSRDLFSGGERFPDFFEETTLEHARRLISSLSDADLDRQLATVRASLQAARLSTTEVPRPTYELVPRDQPISSDELLAAAVKLGHQLADRAFTNDREAHWLALDHKPHRGWCLVSAGPDFYQGLPGLIFFYAYLGSLTSEPRFTALARLALRTLDHQIEQGDHPLEGIGAYGGWSGLLYTFTHLSTLWGEAELLDRAEGLAQEMLPQAPTDELLDLVAGAAGCLVTALRAYRVRPSAIFRELAVACGERLLATAQAQEHGAGWVIELTGPRPIAGMSHGAAGISWALLELWGETGDERYREAARQGIEMERHLFSQERGNWPDLRVGHPDDQGVDSSEGQHFMAAWCHGAPGIGLARILGLPFLDDATVRKEIAVAVGTTLDEGLGLNHSLCHGDLGNLDFLHRAAAASSDSQLERRVFHLAGGVVDNLRREGPLCGLPRGSDPPSLMLGMAGIGYGLARLAAPDAIPSVLALDPIPGARS